MLVCIAAVWVLVLVLLLFAPNTVIVVNKLVKFWKRLKAKHQKIKDQLQNYCGMYMSWCQKWFEQKFMSYKVLWQNGDIFVCGCLHGIVFIIYMTKWKPSKIPNWEGSHAIESANYHNFVVHSLLSYINYRKFGNIFCTLKNEFVISRGQPSSKWINDVSFVLWLCTKSAFDTSP